jgi:hypothetical protein
MNTVPLINGSAYDYVHISLSILGVPVVGVKAINYTEEQAKENNYGTGTQPVSRGQGEKVYTASLELPMEEGEKIRAASPTRALTDIDMFDIVVVHGVVGKVAIHTIKNCEFLDDGVEASSGDAQIVRNFNLIPSHIKYL